MKILLIRNGRVGDMVMCTPALAALHENYPTARFSLLTSPDGRRLLKNFSDRMDDFWIYNRQNPFLLSAKNKIKIKIKAAGFDMIFNFESNKTYRTFVDGASTKIFNILDIWKRGAHYSQNSLDLVSGSLGKDVGYYPEKLNVQDAAIEKAKQQLLEIGVSDKTFLVSFHPTFSAIKKIFRGRTERRNRLWPFENYGRLGIMLSKFGAENKLDIKVVINLMPDEMDIGEKILKHAEGSISVICPPPDFQAYLGFLKRTDVLVTNNTGPMHLAAAVGTQLIALFAGHDPKECSPFVDKRFFDVICAEDTEHPKRGISAISTEHVFNACIKRIQNSPKIG
jgi:heptosyltransferase-2